MSFFTRNWSKWASLAGALFFVALLAFYAFPGLRKAAAEGKPLNLATVGKVMKEEKEKKDKEHEKKHEHDEEKKVEYRGVAYLADGSCYLASKHSIWKVEGESLVRVEGYPGSDPHAITADPAGTSLWIAGKNGAYQFDGTTWSMRKSGEFRSIDFAPDGAILLSTKEDGILHSADGKTWAPWALASKAPAEVKPEKYEEKEKKEHAEKTDKATPDKTTAPTSVQEVQS